MATQLSNTPSQRVDFCSRAIPEIPPSPPFSKGGWGGFQSLAFNIEFSVGNLESLHVHSSVFSASSAISVMKDL